MPKSDAAIVALVARLQAETAALRKTVHYLRFAVMGAHDQRLHDDARRADPNYTSIPQGCDCQLCSMRAPLFDVYLGRNTPVEKLTTRSPECRAST